MTNIGQKQAEPVRGNLEANKIPECERREALVQTVWENIVVSKE